jgi:hypothetical protein
MLVTLQNKWTLETYQKGAVSREEVMSSSLREGLNTIIGQFEIDQ